MKNITVSVDEQTYRRARVRAAEQDTSVSALVKRFLAEFAGQKSPAERLLSEEHELRRRIDSFSATARLPREQVHQRRR